MRLRPVASPNAGAAAVDRADGRDGSGQGLCYTGSGSEGPEPLQLLLAMRGNGSANALIGERRVEKNVFNTRYRFTLQVLGDILHC